MPPESAESRPSADATPVAAGTAHGNSDGHHGSGGPDRPRVPDAIELLGRLAHGRLAMSVQALPCTVAARHLVVDGGAILRMDGGSGYHHACNGAVVAYGADNFNSGEQTLWSVQFTGTAELARPTAAELARFGTRPRTIDGRLFEPAYLRIVPGFITVQTMDYFEEPPTRHTA